MYKNVYIVLFITAKNRSAPMPSTGARVRALWYTHTMGYDTVRRNEL